MSDSFFTLRTQPSMGIPSREVTIISFDVGFTNSNTASPCSQQNIETHECVADSFPREARGGGLCSSLNRHVSLLYAMMTE